MSFASLRHESSASDGTMSCSGLAGVRDHASLSVIVASGALSIAGTSSAESTRVWEAPYIHEPDTTASGPSCDPGQIRTEPEATRKAISELRRVSGLTWRQLGQLFEVSRRSVHFWASGKPLNTANEQRLMRVLEVVRGADRGSARNMRTALLDASKGMTPFDMLITQRFDEARVALGPGLRGEGPISARSGLRRAANP